MEDTEGADDHLPRLCLVRSGATEIQVGHRLVLVPAGHPFGAGLTCAPLQCSAHERPFFLTFQQHRSTMSPNKLNHEGNAYWQEPVLR